MYDQLLDEQADLRCRIRAYNYRAWLYNQAMRARALECPDSCAWRGMQHSHVHDSKRDKPYITFRG